MSVYKLVGNGLIYYGSTGDIKARLRGHKSSYNHYLKGKTNYVSSFEIIKGDYECVVLETGLSKKEMKERERWYIENSECVNIHIPNRNKDEWYETNRNNRLEYCIEYNKKRSNRYIKA